MKRYPTLNAMRDLKDAKTLELPGFTPIAETPAEPRRGLGNGAGRRKAMTRQEQLELLDPTDATGLPPWVHDDTLDLTGLPIWAKD